MIERQYNRRERRAARAMEVRGLNGNWGEWRIDHLPHGIPGGSGWCRDIRFAWANNLYAVLVRPFIADNGEKVSHVAIRTASSLEPPWRDMQRIKNELFGKESVAVSVMPPESQLVDDADMYHMWVLSRPLPFSLKR